MDGTALINFILSVAEELQGGAARLLAWFSSPLKDLNGGSTFAAAVGVSSDTLVIECFFGVVLSMILVMWIIRFIMGLLPI